MGDDYPSAAYRQKSDPHLIPLMQIAAMGAAAVPNRTAGLLFLPSNLRTRIICGNVKRIAQVVKTVAPHREFQNISHTKLRANREPAQNDSKWSLSP
jgi:hypothetical protein